VENGAESTRGPLRPRGDENSRLIDNGHRVGVLFQKVQVKRIRYSRSRRERNPGGPPAEQSGRCGETAQGAAATRETRSRIKRGLGAESVGCSDLTLNVGCSLR
jgi:hypothetical protein